MFCLRIICTFTFILFLILYFIIGIIGAPNGKNHAKGHQKSRDNTAYTKENGLGFDVAHQTCMS